MTTVDRDSELYLDLTGDAGRVRCHHCGRLVDFTRDCSIVRSGVDGRCRVNRCGGCALVDADTRQLFGEVVASLVDVFGVDRTRAELARALGCPPSPTPGRPS